MGDGYPLGATHASLLTVLTPPGQPDWTGCGRLSRSGFVSGHDVSRADKANKTHRVLAPEALLLVAESHYPEFFRSLWRPVLPSHLDCG